jgi:putative sigma-54 modulation protein
MKEYARKKTERLSKCYDRLQAIRVVLQQEGTGFFCEMIAEIEHMHDLVGRADAEEMTEAIDLAVDRLERQLVEHKDRIRDRKGRGPNPHQPTRT